MPRERFPVQQMVGFGLGGLFLLTGIIATLVQWAPLCTWLSSWTWSEAPAYIQSSTIREIAVNKRRYRTTYAPDFTFLVTVDGRRVVAAGYDLTNYRGPRADAQAIIDAYPVGKETTALLNPAAPEMSVLTRGYSLGLVLMMLGPFFSSIGLLGVGLAMMDRVGAFDSNSRHVLAPVGRLLVALATSEPALRAVFWFGIVAVVSGVVWIGYSTNAVLAYPLAAFIGWSVWKASRPQSGKGKRRR